MSLYTAGRLCPAHPAELVLPSSPRILFQLWDRGMEINQSTLSPQLSEKLGKINPVNRQGILRANVTGRNDSGRWEGATEGHLEGL